MGRVAMTYCRAGLEPPVAAPGPGPPFFHLVSTTFLVWTTFFPPYIDIWDHLRFSVGGHPDCVHRLLAFGSVPATRYRVVLWIECGSTLLGCRPR